MTILLDHDFVGGVPMAQFISALTPNIEKGIGLSQVQVTPFKTGYKQECIFFNIKSFETYKHLSLGRR